MEFPAVWLQEHWFNAVQTVGIVGSLLFTLATIRRDTRSREVTNYLTLAAQHRELWIEAHRRPELARIGQSEADLVANPISTAEEEFLLLALTHIHTGWLVIKDGGLVPLDVLALDVRDFISRPLPRAIWHQSS